MTPANRLPRQPQRREKDAVGTWCIKEKFSECYVILSRVVSGIYQMCEGSLVGSTAVIVSCAGPGLKSISLVGMGIWFGKGCAVWYAISTGCPLGDGRAVGAGVLQHLEALRSMSRSSI